MRIGVAGGSAAGLFTSLLLARAGHEVVLVEQERLDPAPDPETAALSAFRASAPQIVQPHIIMAKCRELMAELLPDVYEVLLAAGVAEVPLATHMPPTLADRRGQPGDVRLTTMATRRSTIDWALQHTALGQPGLTIRSGSKVTGLIARRGDPPHVTGLHTNRGDIHTDLIIDAAGRRSPIEAWLRAIGAKTPPTRRAKCGIAYFTRHYRIRPDTQLPGPAATRLIVGLDEFTAGIWGADNGVMQLAVAPLANDRRFHRLSNPDVHSAVLRTVPALARWLDALDPITDVMPMAGLHNTMRRLVTDGTPVVTGLHSVGDSVCTTNPTLGRGLALALNGAADLVAVITEHPEDGTAQAKNLDARVADHIVPFFEDQAAIDEARLAMLRHTIFGTPAPDPPPHIPGRVTFAQVRTAAMIDPTAFRGLWTVQGMLRRPEDVYRDPQVVASTRDALNRHKIAAIPQPTRDQLLTALGGG